MTNQVLYSLEEALNRIAFEAVRIIQVVMESDKGINKKTGTNTLIDSNIYNDIEYDANENGIINIMINNYIDNIESGRKAGAKKVPTDVLIAWMVDKGISTENGMVWMIQESIFKNGISPRPIFETVYEMWDEEWNKTWADEIVNEILADLTDFFNN